MDLRPPPADAYKKKTPIMEELGCLALEGMADELKKPSKQEKSHSIQP